MNMCPRHEIRHRTNVCHMCLAETAVNMARFMNGELVWKIRSELDQSVFVTYGELLPRQQLSVTYATHIH